MVKPILLGMNNPLSADPEHALYPAPEGCTGWRIWKMLQEVQDDVTRLDYLQMFDRRNLVAGRQWSKTAAREEAAKIHDEVYRRCMDGEKVSIVVLGAEAWSALSLKSVPWCKSLGDLFTGQWWRVPHPSGLNHWYNETRNRRAAARLMLKLATGDRR